MAPPFTQRMVDAVAAGSRVALLAEINMAAQDYNFWSGIGPLSYDGSTWIGLGRLGRVKPISYSTDLAIQEINLELTGVSLDDTTWLTADIRNRTASVWLAALDANSRVIASPRKVLAMTLDYAKYSVAEDGTAAITIVARSGFFNLERSIDEVYSAENQRATYPDDSGCDLIPSLQDKDVIWAPV